MSKIKLKQIFMNTDLRGGERALGELYRRASLKSNEVYLCMNKTRDIIKVLGRRGMFIDRLPRGQTFDFTLRREQIFNAIGKYFGFTVDMSADVYRTVQRDVNARTKGGDIDGKNKGLQRKRDRRHSAQL